MSLERIEKYAGNGKFRESLEEKEGFFIRFDTFASIERALLNAFGPEGLTILYLAGVECGRRYYDRVSRIARDESEILEVVKRLKRNRNWGEFHIEIDRKAGTCRVTIINPFELRGNSDKSCPYIRGYMVGFLSRLLGKEVKFEKEVCEEDTCEFYYKIPSS